MNPEQLFSWACSALSLAMIWAMGNKSLWGPRLGLLAQGAWIGFTLVGGHWGLAPAVIGFTVVHVRNYRKWKKELSDEHE